MAARDDGRKRVFLSYSHVDDRWRDRFLVHAKSWDLDVWADPYIRVGQDWHREIGDALDAADVGVCLVSVDFLASDYIREHELKPIRDREDITAFPIPVRSAQAYERHGLGALQWPQPPDKPLDSLRPADRRDRTLGELVKQLAELVEELAPQGHDDEPNPTREAAVPIAPAGAPGGLWGAPAPEARFRGRRGDLADVTRRLREPGSGSVGVTATSPAVGVHGRGGLGKTALALQLVWDEEFRRLFPDGVWWLTLGQDPSLHSLQRALLSAVGVSDLAADLTVDQATRLLRSAFSDRQALLVLDDVWDGNAVSTFDVMGPRGRLLVTTRRAANLALVDATAVELDALVGDAARQVLADHAHIVDLHQLPPEADQVIEATDGLPLGLAAAGAQVRFGVTWARLVERLGQGRGAFGPHPQSSQLGALLTGVQALCPPVAARYQELAPYPEDTAIPVSEIEVLWSATGGLDAGEVRATLDELAERGLLSQTDSTVHLHDLQRDLLVLLSEDLAAEHAALVDAHRGLLDPPGAWWSLPARHGPFADRLVHHLSAANLVDELEQTVGDLRYLAVRLSRRGVRGVVLDLEVARARTRTPAIEAGARLIARMGFIAENLPLPDCASTLRALATAEPDLDGTIKDLDDLVGPVSLLRDVPLPERARPALVRTIGERNTTVGGISASPDGRHLVSGSRNGSSYMWDPKVEWTDTVRVWDTRTGAALCSLLGHADAVLSTAVAPDRRWFVSASADATLRVWDWAARGPAGDSRLVLEGHTGPVTSVAVTPDGTTIVSGSNDETIRLWDATDGRLRGVPLRGHTGRVYAVAVAADGSFLASAGQDRTVRLWDLATGEALAVLHGHEDAVRSVAISPDGARVASGAQDDTIRVWDVRSRASHLTITAHSAGVSGVAFAPDGRYLASSSLDTTVRTWDPVTGAPLNVLTGHTDGVKDVVVLAQGALVGSVGRDNVLRIWSPDTPGGPVDLDALGPIAGVGASTDGTTVVTARWDGTLRTIAPSTGATLSRLEGHIDKVVRCTVSPNGRLALSASRDGTLRVWDLDTSETRHVLDGHRGPVTGCSMTPAPGSDEDPALGVSSSTDGTLCSWDLASGTLATRFVGHDGPVVSCAVTADGRSVVSGGQDACIRRWDLASGAMLDVMRGHGGPVVACAPSRDGRHLVSASLDSTLRIWELSSGEATAVLDQHQGPVVACAFSPDDEYIASVSSDSTVRIWSRSTGESLCGLRTAGWLGDVTWVAADRVLAVGAGGIYLLTVNGLADR